MGKTAADIYETFVEKDNGSGLDFLQSYLGLKISINQNINQVHLNFSSKLYSKR